MKTYNFTQLLCTSILSALVGMIMVFTALTVKPHNEIAAATNTTSELVKVASLAHVQASITFEVPTVAKVEVVQDATQPEAKAEPTNITVVKVAKVVNDDAAINKAIEDAKAYCLAHMVHPEPIDFETPEPAKLIAAK